MNNLTTNFETKNMAKKIYAFCRSIHPQFYKRQTPEEMVLEVEQIAILFNGIDERTINKMCELAVQKFQRENDGTLIFNPQFIFGRKMSAEYLIRNNMESFDEVYTSVDDLFKDETWNKK